MPVGGEFATAPRRGGLPSFGDDVRDRTAGVDQAELESSTMNVSPMNRAERRQWRTTSESGRSARRLARALALIGLCIAAFECSQLVFQTPAGLAWAKTLDLMAGSERGPHHPASNARV